MLLKTLYPYMGGLFCAVRINWGGSMECRRHIFLPEALTIRVVSYILDKVVICLISEGETMQ